MKIDKNKEYTLGEIARYKILGTTNINTVRNRVNEDRRKGNYLNATIMGEGKNTRYFIEGKNLIKYLEKTK